MTTGTARKPTKAERREINRNAAAVARKAKAKELTQLRDNDDLVDIDNVDALADAFASLTEHYSEGNAMLILKQAAAYGLKVRGLRDVGGFNAFADRGRKIKDSEKSNRIFGVWARITRDDQEADHEETSASGKRERFAVVGIYHVSQTEKIDTPEVTATIEQTAATDADRAPGETRRAYAARTYVEWTQAQYDAAETATR